jgi:S1-C subfamily serine protease
VITKLSVLLGLGLSTLALAAGKEQPQPQSFGADTRLVLTESSVASLLATAEDGWRPKVARTRGGVELFAKVAPGTVVVRTGVGHGTGFLIGPEGFLLTNHHVIAEGMSYDRARRASVAKVHLGRLADDGTMVLAPQPVDALFYAADRNRDLALLRLAQLPPGLAALPVVKLAEQAPRPGQACSMVGHPASGMLWTFRSCQVAAIGRSPGDLVDFMVQRLAATSAARREIEEGLAAVPGRRIVLSSCEANPGDSGGPVVDEAGRLVAVTFAIPGEAARSKFTYHVHLDEVRAFLASRPEKPTVLTPDAWELGPRVELRDLLGEGRPQLLRAGVENPEQFLFDLDGDTDEKLLRSRDRSLIAGRKFEVEFALHASRRGVVAFYDTDNDGTFDLLVQGKNGKPEVVLTRGRDGGWEVRPAEKGDSFVRPRAFANPALVDRFVKLVGASGIF